MKAERKEKIAVFGGSFDPPHYGHYDIVKNLEKSFDRVIVVPSFVSPFKPDADAADAKKRLKLCKSFFASDRTEVCAREVNKKTVSYSVDTAAWLCKKHGDAKLFWVIGSEEVNGLARWHDIDRLKKLVTFFVVPRPGYAVSEDTLKNYKKQKIKIKFAKFEGLDISSTVIKLDIAFNRPNKYIPSSVAKAIKSDGLFDPYGKYVDALYKHDLSEKRLNHTYGVAVRGAELAKLYGCSVRDAVVACILHDIAKSKDPDKYKGEVDTKGFPAPTMHGPIGAYIAKREFGVSDEIEHAIRIHSTADADMSLLDEIVYLADKTEAGRSYNEVYYLRYLCSVDRELAMHYALGKITEYKNKDMIPCEMSARAIKYYAKKCKGKTMPDMPKPERKTPDKGALPAVRATAELGELKSKAVRLVPEKAVAKVADKSVAKVADKSVAVIPQSDAAALEIAKTVAAELDLHKARDIDIIDLDGKTIIADYFVIASASSTTAVKALMGYAEDIMTKKYGLDPSRRDIDSEWIALDYGGVIIHIFTDRMREFYNIERLWSDGSNITRIGD